MSDSLLKSMDLKLDKIQESIVEIKVAQAKQEANLQANTDQLELHMHRSDLLEESQEVLYEEVANIKLHKAQMDGVLKFLGIASTIISVAVGLLKLFHKF